MYQDYKPFALLLTNSSGKAIVAINVRWMVNSGGRSGVFAEDVSRRRHAVRNAWLPAG